MLLSIQKYDYKLSIRKRVKRHECLREHQQPKVHKGILPVF